MQRKPGRAEVASLAALTIAAAALRFFRIDSGLWFDEILTVLESVRLPLDRLLTHFPGDNDHPLYSLLAHLSVAALGETPFALRLPAALFGASAIPLIYVVGRHVTTRAEAAAAALILTVSYHHIWFSQNARAYTALVFFVLLSTLALLRWLDRGGRGMLVVYAVATALGAYAHLSVVLVSIGQALALAIDWMMAERDARLRREWRSIVGAFVGAAALTILAYGPMLTAVGAFFTGNETATASDVATPGGALLAAIRGLQVGFGALWVIAAGGVVFVIGAWSYLRQRAAVALLFVLPLAITLLAALALGRPIRPRFVFFAIGFGVLIALRGAAESGRLVDRVLAGRIRHLPELALAAATMAAVLFSLSSLPYGYRYPKQDYEAAIAFIGRARAPGEIAAAVGQTGYVPVAEYHGRAWDRITTAEDLRRLRGPGRPVWVLYTFASYIEDGQPELWAMLTGDCALAAEFDGTVDGGEIVVRRCP